LEFTRLFHRQIGGSGALQDLIHEIRHAPRGIEDAWSDFVRRLACLTAALR
jgi:hypothetical protein